MSKFAEKVYRKINKRTCEVPIDDIEKECIAIIDIALQGQRKACHKMWAVTRNAGWEWGAELNDRIAQAILNAEVADD